MLAIAITFAVSSVYAHAMKISKLFHVLVVTGASTTVGIGACGGDDTTGSTAGVGNAGTDTGGAGTSGGSGSSGSSNTGGSAGTMSSAGGSGGYRVDWWVRWVRWRQLDRRKRWHARG